MKKILAVLTASIMISTMILSQGVFAHQGFSETIDFNTYVGNGSTLSVLPPNGSSGRWVHQVTPSATNGVTSETVTQDRGTSLALKQSSNNYTGLRYLFNSSLKGAVRIKLSMNLTKDSWSGSHAAALSLDGTNMTSGWILPFSFLYGNVRIFNKIIYNGDYPLQIVTGSWYDFEVLYLPREGYYEGSVTVDGETYYASGRSTYRMDTITQAKLLHYGGTPSDRLCTTYFDDFSVSTEMLSYAENPVSDFENYRGNQRGNLAPEGFVLRNYMNKATTGSHISLGNGIINYNDQSDEKTAFLQNFSSYTGNDTSLNVMPADSTGLGSWSSKGVVVSGSNGVTNGTDQTYGNNLMIQWKDTSTTTYNGATYTLKKPSESGIYLSFSTKMEGGAILRVDFNDKYNFRNHIYQNDNAIKVWNKNFPSAEILPNLGEGKKVAQDWMDVVMTIDAKTGNCRAICSQGGTVLVDYSQNIYDLGWTDASTISKIGFSGGRAKVESIMIDNLVIAPYSQLGEMAYSAEKQSFATEGTAYAGAFAKTTKYGTSLALAMNTDLPLSLSKTLDVSLDTSIAFSGDLMIKDYNTTRTVYFRGTDGEGDKAEDVALFAIRSGTGTAQLMGKDTGYVVKPNIWYRVTATYTPGSDSAKLVLVPDNGYRETFTVACEDMDLAVVTDYLVKLSGFDCQFGAHTEMLLDNLHLAETEKVYHKAENVRYEFDIASSYPVTGTTISYIPEEVSISFSNPLAPLTLSDCEVLVNGEMASGVTISDDYTLTIPLIEAEDGVYHIDIIGVRDCYGSVLDDFIEFNVVKGDATQAYVVGTAFTADGEMITNIREGSITATIKLMR